MRKTKFSEFHETMYPFETVCMNGCSREKVKFPHMPNFSKEKDGWAYLENNLLRKRPGKSRMKMSDYVPHEMGTHRVCVFMCTWSSTFCVKATKAHNHCGGDHVTSDLLVCLLNIPLREYEKERSLLLKCMELSLPNHKRNGVLSFQN